MTVTDFFGTERTIYIHDPPIVWERDHRHILRFAFEHVKGGAVRSDFDLYNVPSLAFAARATSAFPGAFPPVQIQEMDSVLSHAASHGRPESSFCAPIFVTIWNST
ncbi:hypothetical protein [Massilia cavernae]|uniref:hypothetical protein n=1 Tax=Massilia cavernae TaxID=2320864 RepID=UPI0011C4440F|nr:hypothetical protein [Massilia cavernae]